MDLHDFDVVAESYDLYVQGLSSAEAQARALSFHLDLADSHGEAGVLDVGCGTGNVAIPMAEAGFTVEAFDVSEAMVRRFRDKVESLTPQVRSRLSTSVQSMVDFTFDRLFSLAMIPGSGFMHLLTPADQRQALERIHRSLEPGGVLTLNTFDPDIPYIASHCQPDDEFETRTELVSEAGTRVEILNRTHFVLDQQRLEGTWRFKSVAADGTESTQDYPLRMRFTFRQEMQYLFELAGFRVEALYGSYEREPPRYPSSLIWVVRKPTTAQPPSLLRDVGDSDLPVFFEQQSDPAACRMAAFTAADPTDQAAFHEKWRRIRNDASVTVRTIVFEGGVAGHIASFEQEGRREVTYWIDRTLWNRGIATKALTEFLTMETTRPLFARAAADNAASIRVLEKCGFRACGRDSGFAHGRGEDIEERVYRLD